MNSAHLGVTQGRLSSKDGKLDYAYLEAMIPYDRINKTLLIVFRAVNFTEGDGGDSRGESRPCETLFIEIEYKRQKSESKCQYNPQMQQGTGVQQLSPESPPYKNWLDQP